MTAADVDMWDIFDLFIKTTNTKKQLLKIFNLTPG